MHSGLKSAMAQPFLADAAERRNSILQRMMSKQVLPSAHFKFSTLEA